MLRSAKIRVRISPPRRVKKVAHGLMGTYGGAAGAETLKTRPASTGGSAPKEARIS